MRRSLPVLLLLVLGGSAQAHGLLIPVEKSLPPLAMLNHTVTISIEDQVAVTTVEQTFRNHTDRQLEATYVFPVPKGASVRKFSMAVAGKDVPGELVEADKARQIYTEIVRRAQDPGLLEYLGNNLFRVRVFPIPPRADQKLTLSYTSVSPLEGKTVEYIYPLKTDGKATRTLEKFSIKATLKSQHALQNLYSPTHALKIERPNDHEAVVTFERDQALLDKDFQLFYTLSDKDVGLTVLAHRPISSDKGFALLLLSPRVELPKDQVVPRDMVLVLDTSGSMRGVKMDQARKALKFCLDQLGGRDRFALINFATTVTKYTDGLIPSDKEQVEKARKWVDELEATGGTAINDALAAALEYRSSDPGRTFTVVFFTDGCPTIGETEPDKILKNVAARNTANTRIFTFGVGDDVNATMLDQLADQTRAVCTYVRPAEDIGEKVAGLYGKISHPVLADLKLTAGPGLQLEEVYPPQLPDLFHGGQVVVLARYRGQGHAALKLTGKVGMETREYVYETGFPAKTGDEKGFVEHLWGRRKVGYLLDQIRAHGEKKELVDEVVALAKRYGIATPYTSYLVVPDAPVPVAAASNGKFRTFMPPRHGGPGVPTGTSPAGLPGGDGTAGTGFNGGFGGGGIPYGLIPETAGKPSTVTEFARKVREQNADVAQGRGKFEDDRFSKMPTGIKGEGKGGEKPTVLDEARQKKAAYDRAREALKQNLKEDVQTGKLGVDLSVQTNNLRNQSRLDPTAQRKVGGRTCLEIGGVWIDEGFDAKMPVVTVKAMSDAYFRLLERHPEVKPVLQLSNHLVWVTPSGTALVIDTSEGKEKLADAEIDKLFVAKK